MSHDPINCIGRRRLDLSVVDGKVQIRITLGDKPLAHLQLEPGEAAKFHAALVEVLNELKSLR